MGRARRRDGVARVGCSGWIYRDWRGIVYPEHLPQRAWFEHYATLFDTVEINNTFYRLPRRRPSRRGPRRPAGFEYALKVGQFGSHRMKLRDAANGSPTTSTACSASARHLGPNLVQLPPRWRRNVERLDEFLTAAPERHAWAVELGSPRGCTTTCSRCSPARRRAVHPRPARRPPVGAHHRLDLRALPRAERSRRSTTAATAAGGSGGWPTGCRPGSTRAAPSTPTSTTTTRATRSSTPDGSRTGSRRSRGHLLVRERAVGAATHGQHGDDHADQAGEREHQGDAPLGPGAEPARRSSPRRARRS